MLRVMTRGPHQTKPVTETAGPDCNEVKMLSPLSDCSCRSPPLLTSSMMEPAATLAALGVWMSFQMVSLSTPQPPQGSLLTASPPVPLRRGLTPVKRDCDCGDCHY